MATNRLEQFVHRLFEPVSSSTLVVTRIGVGAVLTWNFALMLLTGVGYAKYQEPSLQFFYPGLEWLVRLSAPGMMVLVWLSLAASICVALGLAFRVAAPLLVFTFSYLLFHDPLAYSNFHYLAILTLFWLALTPANGALSVDTKLFASQRRETTPRWATWILRFQIGVAYFYGGIVKFNEDWLGGEPVRQWLEQASPALATEPVVMFFAYSGLLFDLTIALWLLLPRTRVFAVAAAAFFHITNEFMFEVGVLPFFMIVMIVIFLPHDAFARLLPRRETSSPTAGPMKRRAILALLTAWVAFQLLFPLRHLLYPGDGRWTHEGQKFSWWFRHASFASDVDAHIEHADGTRTKLDPTQYLTKTQYGLFIDPNLVVQFAHHVKARDYPEEDIKIFVDVRASLNRRPWQQFIPGNVDLVQEQVRSHQPWVVPLGEQLLDSAPTD